MTFFLNGPKKFPKIKANSPDVATQLEMAAAGELKARDTTTKDAPDPPSKKDLKIFTVYDLASRLG